MPDLKNFSLTDRETALGLVKWMFVGCPLRSIWVGLFTELIGRDIWSSSCPYPCSSRAVSLSFLLSEIQEFPYCWALYNCRVTNHPCFSTTENLSPVLFLF